MSHLAGSDSHGRSRRLRNQVFWGFVFKGVGAALSYATVPLMLKYLGEELFGVWMTLLSIISWFAFFDLGIGNGLRNRLSESLALGSVIKSRHLVTSAYVVLTIIAAGACILTIVGVPLITWQRAFNTNIVEENVLRTLLVMTLVMFFFNFILSPGNQIFYAYQQSALTGLNQMLSQVLTLGGLLILLQIRTKGIVQMSLVYTLAAIAANLILIMLFTRRHPEVALHIGAFRISSAKSVAGLGVQFLIIQLSSLIIFSTTSVVITRILGPLQVTPYSIANRLFSVVVVGHSILCAPLWASYTEAWTKGDLAWVKRTIKRLALLTIPIMALLLVLIVFKDWIVVMWLGRKMDLSFSLVVMLAVSTLLTVWNNVFATFLAGIAEVRIQLIAAIAAGGMNIPLAIYFTRIWGVTGAVVASVVSMGVFAIASTAQGVIILRGGGKRKGSV